MFWKKERINDTGIFIGFCCIIAGIFFFFSIEKISFDADFYTYIYQGVATIVKILSILLIAFGSFMDCHFIGEKQKQAQMQELQKINVQNNKEDLPVL